VQAFTRLVGPSWIGVASSVTGSRVTTVAIGPHCRVSGEMSHVIMFGFANKGHDGFVGHSVLGRWVNLGAGTITSNLKNTYGPVALWTPAGVQETGLQFLGTFFGDHAKTGIGVRLTTGCVIGAGANCFDAMPPKAVAPFSWGSGAPYGAHAFDKFLETAERMMARRSQSLDAKGRSHWSAVHRAQTTES
jgi:UDP-N-acetylglucosamine diphosphorylase / glucose-1-phosphate thymidylyltransferase / UDP-N-acetylgalactosamine diphosphorylase / glucosamine-1-phosphate N-acetyltransferase / galactosamine-1-phosphate N-acetyltransferase